LCGFWNEKGLRLDLDLLHLGCFRWSGSYIDGSGGQVTNDPAATTDPCAGRNG